jgi:enoyl-CoA hydratase
LGGAYFRFLSRAGWDHAIHHLLLCDEFNAALAREIGLVQEVVSACQQIERAMELAASTIRRLNSAVQDSSESNGISRKYTKPLGS